MLITTILSIRREFLLKRNNKNEVLTIKRELWCILKTQKIEYEDEDDIMNKMKMILKI